MNAEKMAAAEAALDALTTEERVAVLDNYCLNCGDKAPLGCQCMNDD
jgi:hypothetical protein